MTNLKFLKTLTAGIALATALYPQAWAEIKSATSCGGKCTYYYDTVSKDLRIEKNANIADGEEVIIPSGFYGSIGNTNNVTIGEGITGMGKWAFASYGGHTDGNSNSTLKLPSTFKHRTESEGAFGSEFWNVGFGTIDASAVKDTTIYMPIDHNQNVILDPNSNVKIGYGCAYNPGASRNINTICKGKLSECEKMIIGSHGQITSSYYVGDDGNGNWEVWSDEGKAVYADSTLQKPLGKYDFDGNQTGVYKYDGAGNLTAAYENGVSTYKKTSYTPAEAAAAIKKGNNNKITFTFK